MAAKGKSYRRLESEIEKCRVEDNWSRALEITKQLSDLPNKPADLETYCNFVTGECKLQTFLEEHPLGEVNTLKARQCLAESEAYLGGITHTESKMKKEAELLFAKIHYAKGQYQNAINAYDVANLDSISVSTSSSRSLHIIAEAFAIKANCLEKLPAGRSSKFKAAEREERIMACLERAGDISLLFLQEKEKAMDVSQSPGLESKPNNILGLAIQRSPILYIKRGMLEKGVGRFRQLLMAVESRCSQTLRQVLSRQLAQVLIRGMCSNTYIAMDEQISSPDTLTTPRKYNSKKMFMPNNENEETLLLLLISEAIATREAVLDTSSEHSESRSHAFNATSAVYDLLALTLVKRAQFNMLAESFERAMRFSFDEFHIWYQFALSLICAQKYTRAMVVLRQCVQLQPHNPVVALQGAKICYENLYNYDEGIVFSEKATAMGTDHYLSSRAYTALGIGYSMKSLEYHLHGNSPQYQQLALDSFLKAYKLDPHDYLACFHTAVQLAHLRQLGEAMKFVQEALSLKCGHVYSLHLLILLLSAQKQYQEALNMVESALVEYPDNLGLLLTKVRLEEVVFGPDEALVTCQHLLELWRGLHDVTDDDSISRRRSGLIDRLSLDRRSVAQLQINELSDRDSAYVRSVTNMDISFQQSADGFLRVPGSIRAESVAASRVEKTLSDVASSLTVSVQQRSGPHNTWMLQAQIWLHLAELYLTQDKIEEAESCVQETSTIYPHSHHVAFMRGRLHEYRHNYLEAKICYENAISINAGHIKSLQHLGLTLHQLNNDKMAEKILREAVNIEPTNHLTWCMCTECVDTPTNTERVCCQESPKAKVKLHDLNPRDGVQGHLRCITHHPGFGTVCLNRHVLDAAYNQYIEQCTATIREKYPTVRGNSD